MSGLSDIFHYNELNLQQGVDRVAYIESLQAVIDFIEENITQPISIDECASIAGFSKYHFHRMFGVYMGTPLMEYVRKRRLAYAMCDVCRGKRILDIAMDYGHSSERSFGRAFMQEYGKPPSRFRDTVYMLPEKPMLARSYFRSIGGNVVVDGMYSEVRFEELETMYVASSTRVSQTPEDDVIEFMTRWADENGIAAAGRRFGFDVPVSEKEHSEGLRGYEYWIEVSQDTPVSDGVVLKKVEGCRYAVLRITDPFADPFRRIPGGWRKLVEWVEARGYGFTCCNQRYCLEEVIERNGTTYMDVFLPVR